MKGRSKYIVAGTALFFGLSTAPYVSYSQMTGSAANNSGSSEQYEDSGRFSKLKEKVEGFITRERGEKALEKTIENVGPPGGNLILKGTKKFSEKYQEYKNRSGNITGTGSATDERR